MSMGYNWNLVIPSGERNYLKLFTLVFISSFSGHKL